MKKWVMTAGVVGLVVSASVAQSVTSENIVGYNKAEVKMGLQIMATHFNVVAGDPNANTPETVFGNSLPEGTKVFVFDNGDYYSAEYVLNWDDTYLWDNVLDLGHGVGYWVQMPGVNTNIVISGEVNAAPSVTNSIVKGLQLLSYPYPVSRTVTQLGFTPSEGDKIFKYIGNDYLSAEYIQNWDETLYWDNDFSIGVGEGFWYQSNSASVKNWVVNRPFSL